MRRFAALGMKKQSCAAAVRPRIPPAIVPVDEDDDRWLKAKEGPEMARAKKMLKCRKCQPHKMFDQHNRYAQKVRQDAAA